MDAITPKIKEVVEKLIDDAASILITTIDEEGFPQTRAMLAIRKREGLNHLYFTTNTSSQKVKQLLNNPKSCVYIYNAGNFIGAMLIGTTEVLQDEISRKLIWRTGDEIYYPKGVCDPDYCVLKFTPKKLRFYSDLNPRNFEINS